MHELRQTLWLFDRPRPQRAQRRKHHVLGKVARRLAVTRATDERSENASMKPADQFVFCRAIPRGYAFHKRTLRRGA